MTMIRTPKELMILMAESQLGRPYEFESNGAGSWDCSGFVCELLRCGGFLDRTDRSAQTLHNYHKAIYFKKVELQMKPSTLPEPCDIVYFGKSEDEITHVGMIYQVMQLNGKWAYYMIEAGGGDSSTTTPEQAKKRGAMVRFRPITYFTRLDVVAIYSPEGLKRNIDPIIS